MSTNPTPPAAMHPIGTLRLFVLPRKKCLRTISDELTLSEAVDLTAPNLEVCFDPSLPWPDRAHIDR
ncbi:hypothetical protein VNO80_33792 [Phaseolus coccineus]|uniref:Uncharacterized protein n=1 Tax=Phaseolus coccineus TaxID=3886 RepID=A0AAN9KY11_PHACN